MKEREMPGGRVGRGMGEEEEVEEEEGWRKWMCW